ncbi:GAP family protein [Novosphingobium sp. PhB55]|jgi:hypothetical protein|uniref:GAP family protein n=1 Tax=unclassified Novosphingobium TaxID=2644732 RepID=UPI0010648390|nr:GAP family protein [Novosphingobium sp. PhB55]TDW64522.1 Sap-like sulfolipid-1-addressing protein [Novosphingobium sp. PhB55]
MLEAAGELLPLAVGISISPLPIIALIVLLMSPQAGRSTPAFLLGWIASISTALLVFAYLSKLGFGSGGAGNIAAIVKLALGAGLLYLAVREWRARPKPGETATLPHWLEAVKDMRPLSAGLLGFGIYAANPKNLTMGIASGVAFGSAHLPPGPAIAVAAIFVLTAASTILVPVVAFWSARQRVQPWLDEMREWLTQHNTAVMAVLLLVVSAMMLGKGIAALTS